MVSQNIQQQKAYLMIKKRHFQDLFYSRWVASENLFFNSSLYSKDGVIYFDMEEASTGLYVLTDSLKDNPIPPVFITDFRLFNKSVLPGQ